MSQFYLQATRCISVSRPSWTSSLGAASALDPHILPGIKIIRKRKIETFAQFKIKYDHHPASHLDIPNPGPLGVFLDKETDLGDVLLSELFAVLHELGGSKVGVEQITFDDQDNFEIF